MNGRIIKQTIEQANLPLELPVAVTNIPIGLKFARLYCFTGTGWHENEGVQIGSFALHYVNGHTDNLPIRYGIHVRDCIARPALRDNDQPLEHGRVVWTGMNDHARELKGHLRLYLAAWDNPHRDEVVRSVDFVSTMSDSAPFLIAMTVEP